MSKSRQMSATLLRIILTIGLFLIAGLAVAGFYLATDALTKAADDTSKTIGEANNSRDNVQNLQRVQAELEKNKQAVERASNIVAESQSYQYQDQIISDLTDYAVRAGVSINNFDFSGATSANPGSTPQTPAAKPAIQGVNSVSVSVTLKSPTSYESLLRFIYSVEQNLTKMQISRIGLSKDATGGLTSDILTIQVFIR